jgi:Domain of unknown function (DUF4328)
MIQVCSQCGTRWNVRDRQRAWCPRCHGTLLAPSGSVPDSPWAARPTAPPVGGNGQSTPPRLPPGYRWIAVRPGAAPPPRRGRRPLGPTPRYSVIPSWGLVEYFDTVAEPHAEPRRGPSASLVRAILIATLVVLGGAALVHVVRYALLLINRTVLLNPVLAWAATWFGVLASVLAMFTVVASVIVLTNWLIARRAAAFAHRRRADPRPAWALWTGCLVPVLNLVWAPVFVIELARAEDRFARLRRPIVLWWIVWLLSSAVAVWSMVTTFTVTFFTHDAQGIADNTVTTIIGYLLALAALLLATQVFLGFERAPVERPVKRWVIVAEEPAEVPEAHPDTDPESAVPVESKAQNPAA